MKLLFQTFLLLVFLSIPNLSSAIDNSNSFEVKKASKDSEKHIFEIAGKNKIRLAKPTSRGTSVEITCSESDYTLDIKLGYELRRDKSELVIEASLDPNPLKVTTFFKLFPKEVDVDQTDHFYYETKDSFRPSLYSPKLVINDRQGETETIDLDSVRVLLDKNKDLKAKCGESQELPLLTSF